MEKEELSAGQRIEVGEMTLLPIVGTSVNCQSVSRGIIYSGRKHPVGIVVVSPEWEGAISVAGEEVPVEQYAEQVPEVKELLNGM